MKFRSLFFKDVFKLSLGVGVGRLITIASFPIVTRLYSPEDFSLLAVYLAIISIGSVAACMRLDVAIPLAKNDIDATNLFYLAIMAAISTVLVFAVVAILFGRTLPFVQNNPELIAYFWLVPTGMLASSFYSISQFWATRKKRFGTIAMTRVSQSFIGVSTTIGMGVMKITPLGLLLGNMLTTSAGVVRLMYEAYQKDRNASYVVSRVSLLSTLKEYRRYPIYSTPESLANIGATQVPILFIAAYQGDQAGFLLLAMQAMAIPMTLLGSAVSQVYSSKAQHELAEKNLAPFTASIVKRLALIGLPVIIIAGSMAPFIIPLIFGEEWAPTGLIITYMVPWIALQFISSPVSMVMFVVQKNRAMLALTFFGFLLRMAFVATAFFSNWDPVLALCISSAIFYGICLRTFLAASKVSQ